MCYCEFRRFVPYIEEKAESVVFGSYDPQMCKMTKPLYATEVQVKQACLLYLNLYT